MPRCSRTAALAAFVMACAAQSTNHAFDIPTHREVTREVLGAISVTISGKPRKFSDRALEQVADANEAVDNISNLSAALFHPERHVTNEALAASSGRLVTLKEQILARLRESPPRGDQARTLLGQALHTIQDFYSHSNFVEMGRSGFESAFGRNAVANPATTLRACPDNPNTLGPGGGGGLTSAYFIGNPFTGCGDLPHPGKCWHGNYTTCDGINKDRPDQGAPGEYQAARASSRAATEDYLKQITDELAGNAKALAALLDVRSFAFVIDDTGSMSADIAGVASTVSQIVTLTDANPDLKPTEWMLERFGDPDIGPLFVTDSAPQLLSAVNALFAHGGGDCPELSQGALLDVVNRALPGSDVYLFTDATAKDPGLGNAAISEAQDKNIRITYALTGSCSPIDPIYIRGARETGGQLFLLNRGEVSKVFTLIKPQLEGNLQTILSVGGALTGAPRTFDVPVDASVTRLVVSSVADFGSTFTLVRPDGTSAADTDPDVAVTSLSSGPIVIVEAPAPGVWRAHVNGGGDFSFIARGNSPIEFYRFDFVEKNEDIHGGYFPIPGQPIAGATGLGQATLFRAPDLATFRLVNEAATTLQPLSLTSNFPEAGRDRFLGDVPVPATPFSVVATATDASGAPIQRQFSTVYRAQTVGVRVDAGLGDTVAAGSSTPFSFSVTNTGEAAASFSISVLTTEGTVRGLTPSFVTLARGAGATSTLTLDVASDVPDGTPVTVRMTATNPADPTLFNTAAVTLRVTTNVDQDADGVPDTEDNCSAASNPDQVNTDGDAFGNACDEDDDNDTVPDGVDNCALAANSDQIDFDRDGIGDACDPATGPPVDDDQCKNGGWGRFDTPAFENQGLCIAFVNRRVPQP
jgi:von Willebrand factor A domain-containing protein 7